MGVNTESNTFKCVSAPSSINSRKSINRRTQKDSVPPNSSLKTRINANPAPGGSTDLALTIRLSSISRLRRTLWLTAYPYPVLSSVLPGGQLHQARAAKRARSAEGCCREVACHLRKRSAHSRLLWISDPVRPCFSAITS